MFASKGTTAGEISVKISYRIIQLFSEGLYASPNKAIEELVSNSFDAGAENVHVILSPDLGDDDASVVVIDDGEGMDADGLANHWIIGQSQKRQSGLAHKGRHPIGKFGIGKLATYVLSNRLTHITRSGGQYYSTSMDYSKIPDATGHAGQLDESVTLDLRKLTKAEAHSVLKPWIDGTSDGYAAFDLFSRNKSWTVAILSDLKPMVTEIKRGRLKWILSTAMPLRSDFNLFLNGERIDSSKIKGAKIGTWQIGKTLQTIPKPCSDEFEVTRDINAPPAMKYGLTHPQLGRVTGHVELYADLLTQGKAAELGRSWGIFVYVRGRLVNADDPYFGISSNKLRHGTLSRFRLEIHIDRLDDELRSSRETVRESSLLSVARNLMEGIFNFARRKHEEFAETEAEGKRAATRVAESPAALTRMPLRHLVSRALDSKCTPTLTKYPEGLSAEQAKDFLDSYDNDLASDEGLIRGIVQSPLGQNVGIAIYDAATRMLEINSLHPFVAYFGDEYGDKSRNLPLELLATSEILLEANMYDLGLKESRIREVMRNRDRLLRELARSTGRRNALLLSQDILNASSDQHLLAESVITAFSSLGFATIPGAKKKRTGLAQAFLGKSKDAKDKSPYNVSISVQAKLKPGQLPTLAVLAPTRVRRLRDEDTPVCRHAMAVLVDFPRAGTEQTKLINEETKARKDTGKTVTFIKVSDFARLVRLAPAKRLGLPDIKRLFEDCITPDDCRRWIDELEQSKPSTAPYLEILEAIYNEQKEMPDQEVEYSVVEARLRHMKTIVIPKEEIVAVCSALCRIVPEFVSAGEDTVAIMSSPQRIMDSFNATIRAYPDGQQNSRRN